MRKYEFLGHTADIRMHVTADSLKELFTAALEGMSEIISGKKEDRPTTTEREIEIQATKCELLLIDFLSEVLTQSHILKVIFTSAQFEILSEKSLKAKIYGYKADVFAEDIKAVTYHDIKIKKKGRNSYETTIVFDI